MHEGVSARWGMETAQRPLHCGIRQHEHQICPTHTKTLSTPSQFFILNDSPPHAHVPGEPKTWKLARRSKSSLTGGVKGCGKRSRTSSDKRFVISRNVYVAAANKTPMTPARS